MQKFRLRFSLVFGVLLMALTLSACRQSESAKSAATSRVTITFWHGMSGAHKTALDRLIHEFNHSQTRYQVVGSNQGDFANLQQKIMAGAKSKTLPTMAQTSYTNVPDYVRGGFITSLDPYLKQTDLKKIAPTFLSASRYQGQTYALPFSKSVRVLFYNHELLKKYHLRVPQSWTEVQQDGQRLKAKGITGIAFDQTFMSELNSITIQSGTPLVSSKLVVNADTKSTLAATHVIYDMLQAKTATTAGTDGYGSSQFFAGKTLFYAGSSAAVSLLKTSTPKGMHWGTTMLPSYHGHRGSSIAGNDLVLFKSASTTQRKGAAAFMKFLLGQKQTIQWAEATGYIPLTKAAQTSRQYRQYLANHPAEKAAVATVPYALQDPAFLGYSQYLTALQSATDKMTTNQATPEQAMAKLQRQAEQAIKDNRTN